MSLVEFRFLDFKGLGDMVRKGLKACPDGMQQAETARLGKRWSQDDLAREVEATRQPVSNFLNGKNVDPKIFVAICEKLELDWEVISGQKSEIASIQNELGVTDLEALVERLREQVQPDIDGRCGFMRVLDMTQRITIDSIYTSVNILEKITRNQRRSIDELLDGCNLEDFDRFVLGRVQHRRIPGIEAVERYDKLLILGKPGAGKTTFLKWLSLQCNAGELHQDRVPIFVTLKEFAEAPGQPTLIHFIAKQWTESKIENAEAAVQHILEAGQSLILLDGLDEVRAEDHDRVLHTIEQSSRQFAANRFVMTCRIAAKEYTFEQFTEVEVADFTKEQIADFAEKWFQHKDPTKAAEFPEALKGQAGLQELATNPLLLTLLCLIFEEQAGFPANRAELYKEGLDVLLKKWDGKRNIRRDVVYKKLSLNRKEDLLSQVAFTAFDRSEYFFKQKFVEGQIQDYIRNLPNAKTDPEALKLDSEAVLKSIEAQHGLLVERARGIYSFSHLTFQEYFTARQIEKSGDFSNLVCHVTERRWREIILLTVGMLQNTDQFMQAMKHQIDSILAQDEELQRFLSWVEQKSRSVEAPYKPAAIRAFYLAPVLSIDVDFARILAGTLDLDLDRYLVCARALDNTRALALDSDCARAHYLDRARARDLDLDLDLDPDHKRTRIRKRKSNSSTDVLDRDRDRTRARARARDFDRARARDLALDIDIDRDLDLDRALNRALDRASTRRRLRHKALDRARACNLELDRALERALDPELQRKLQQLRDQPPPTDDQESYINWWKDNRQTWTEQLRETMIQYRNIGHDWQFTEGQQKLLEQYYTANELLVTCLNSDCYVSLEVREEIEVTLLLPLRSGSPIE